MSKLKVFAVPKSGSVGKAAGDSPPCSASSPAAASTVSPASKPAPRPRAAISLSKAEAALLNVVPEVGLDALSWSEETHTVIFRCPCKSHQTPNYIVVRETCALKDHAKSTAHKLCTIILTHLPPSHPRCVLFLDRSVCLQLAVFFAIQGWPASPGSDNASRRRQRSPALLPRYMVAHAHRAQSCRRQCTVQAQWRAKPLHKIRYGLCWRASLLL